MLTCEDVIQCLEDLFPVSLAESWDNVGLLVGRREKPARAVMLCVDVTESVISQAIQAGVSMIVSHHPLIFSGMKQITNDNVFGTRLLDLIQADICVYAMHTNFDVMGMADAAAERLRLLDTEVLQVTYEDEIATEGIGRVGKLMGTMTLEEVAALTKEAFEVPHVKVFGDPDTLCCEVAICPGAGKSLVEDVLRTGADVYITGDIDHHTGIDLVAQGVCVIDAGHYGVEKLFVPYLHDIFLKMMPECTVIRAVEKEPFCIL
ncbi:MAG: Nif3-like dinuclear metal center hexameric protein [Lachnospiraceae bacterium]|nr:Nif3-like dinuclear metal center hexameric protein [Lachnospiraceae bacterium]